MTARFRFAGGLCKIFGLLLAGSGIAMATPDITSVLTTHSTSGAPTSITIIGSALCVGSGTTWVDAEIAVAK
jgi:hypothetical protein